ncbi:MAG: 2-nitropropane dioxygenase [Deltaproteobacteria bacterium HGW-Deltaproteobacteria-2]|jgi:enoyl-[acyl-carrier protein] reductase II|nr:MAG: 2-nitropropane dioxygenase [Deltaproteobacteria bacterium HGW-Deltaproteobacteria-2]
MEKGWKNRITELLGCDYPIILGPMRLITLGSMAACLSNAGGFGVIGASGLSREKLIEEIKLAQSLTNKPVGVNIPVYRSNALDALEVSIDMGIKTIYTSAGDPAKFIDKIKSAGLKVIHKVSNLSMARKAEAAGVDAVVAMGYEAGGHIGREGITTFCLIPVLAQSLKIPVIASGGIADANGLLAALALGAEGVEIGTRFVATNECPVPPFFKESLCAADLTSTVVLGKEAMPIRILKNEIIEQATVIGEAKTDQVMAQQGNADALYVGEGGNKHTAVMPCGQVAGLIHDVSSVSEVLSKMINGTRSVLDVLNKMTSGGKL